MIFTLTTMVPNIPLWGLFKEENDVYFDHSVSKHTPADFE